MVFANTCTVQKLVQCKACDIHVAAGQTLLLFVVYFKQLFAEFCSKMASGSRSKKASANLQNWPNKLKCDRCNIGSLF